MWSGRFVDHSGTFVNGLFLDVLVEDADFDLARFFICVGVNVVRGVLFKFNALPCGGFDGGPCDFIVGWGDSCVCFVALICAV